MLNLLVHRVTSRLQKLILCALFFDLFVPFPDKKIVLFNKVLHVNPLSEKSWFSNHIQFMF